MAITVLEMIPGRMKHGKFTKDDLRPVEVTGEVEARLISQMAAYTLVKSEDTSLRHEDMGDYDLDTEVTRTSLLELKDKCIVAHGKLHGLLYHDIIFFADGKKPVGEAEYSSSYENGRSTYYTKTKYSLVKESGVTVFKDVVYHAKNGNPYHTAHFVPRTLTSVELHPDTEEIGEKAFMGNTVLETALLPSKVSRIEDNAFMGCAALKEVCFGDGLRVIGIEAFKNCVSLARVDFSGGLTLIGSGAFEWCKSLSSITLPDSVQYVRGYAFSYCKSLKKVKLSKGMKEIDHKVFYGCESLETVDIPEGVETIGSEAFQDCDSLRSLRLPATLARLNTDSFPGCGSLVEFITDKIPPIYNGFKDYSAEEWGIRFHSGESNLKQDDDFIFLEDEEPILIGYRGKSLNITLPKDYKGKKYSIRGSAFKHSAVTSITVPEGMTELDEYAFAYCKTLKTVVFPQGMTELPKGVCFWCEGLESVTLPDGLVTVGEDAFNRCGLKTLTLPDSVTTVGKSSFSGCSSLVEVKLGAGVKTLAIGCFYGCSALTSIVVPDGVTELGTVAFKECTSLKCVKLPDTVKVVGHSVFEQCTSLTSLPEGLTEVTNYMFEDCTALTDITVPEGVERLDYRAFAGCTSLRSVSLPGSLHTIKGKAFLNCHNLREVRGWYAPTCDPAVAAKNFRDRHDSETSIHR